MPNTYNDKGKGTIVALKDIHCNEELTSNYREFDDYSKEGDFGFEINFVTFELLHDFFSHFVFFQIHFYTLNLILYPYLTVGCYEQRC